MKTPQAIIAEAMEFKPVAVRVGLSGGNDSLAAAWMMNNVPGCEVFHVNTGIGIERTRQHVRHVCKLFGWPLHEVRAKEDCGMDYDEIVLKHGFPGGAAGHAMMYSCLKERAIRRVVRMAQTKRGARVVLATGIRHDESVRRMRYAGQEVRRDGVTPTSKNTICRSIQYLAMLGMSGECLCGAFAHKGEKALVRVVDPETADRIDALEQRVSAAGFNWGWEGKPPKGGHDKRQMDAFRPLCVGCEKVHALDEAA